MIWYTYLSLFFPSVCVVSFWGTWGPCVGTCKFALQVRNRDVIRPPFPEKTPDNRLAIRPCPQLYQVQTCLPELCPADSTAENQFQSAAAAVATAQSLQQEQKSVFIPDNPRIGNSSEVDSPFVRHPDAQWKPLWSLFPENRTASQSDDEATGFGQAAAVEKPVSISESNLSQEQTLEGSGETPTVPSLPPPAPIAPPSPLPPVAPEIVLGESNQPLQPTSPALSAPSPSRITSEIQNGTRPCKSGI